MIAAPAQVGGAVEDTSAHCVRPATANTRTLARAAAREPHPQLRPAAALKASCAPAPLRVPAMMTACPTKPSGIL